MDKLDNQNEKESCLIPQHSKIALSECSKREEGFKTSEMDARIMLTMQNYRRHKKLRLLSTFQFPISLESIFSPNWLIYSKLKKALFILQIDNFLMAS